MQQNFNLFASWNSCLLLDEYLWGSAKTNQNLLKLCPIERKMAYLVDNKKRQHLFLEENYWKTLEKWCSDNENNIELFRRVFNRFNEKADLVKRKVDKLTRVKPHGLSDEELVNLVIKTRDEIKEITPFDQFGMMTSAIFLEKLTKVLNSDKIGVATMPPWLSTTLKEELDMVTTTLQIMEKENHGINAEEISKKYSKELSTLAEKHGFIPVFLFNPPWDENHYTEEISSEIKKGREKITARINELKNFEENTRKENEAATQGVESHVPEIIRILSFTRNEAELVLSYCQYKLQPFYKEICKRLRISTNQLRHYTENELKSALLQGKADEEMLNRRIAEGVGNYTDAKTERLLTKEEFDQLLKLTGGETKAAVKMLCAFPGKASGKVRIVKDNDDVKNFKDGEVLVSLWTCIDYLPAMKKASAFITEGGGITSHAAVIAREFKVPCIIGYKNATKVFKNGEEIEIDAGNLKIEKKN
ncbi:MAG: PEP-utilizing enzyme [Candidatus Micrarchaeota archaeon]|nr:PEP-utilizing enzyme [Candidatus Micrarchaeota archaeon]